MSNAPQGGEFFESAVDKDGITIHDSNTSFKIVCQRAIHEYEAEWLRRELDNWLRHQAYGRET